MQESRLQRKNDRPMASGLACPFSTGEASRTSGFEAQVWGGRIRRRREINATRNGRNGKRVSASLPVCFLQHDPEKACPGLDPTFFVMAGLVPAIHVFATRKAWMPAT